MLSKVLKSLLGPKVACAVSTLVHGISISKRTNSWVLYETESFVRGTHRTQKGKALMTLLHLENRMAGGFRQHAKEPGDADGNCSDRARCVPLNMTRRQSGAQEKPACGCLFCFSGCLSRSRKKSEAQMFGEKRQDMHRQNNWDFWDSYYFHYGLWGAGRVTCFHVRLHVTIWKTYV